MQSGLCSKCSEPSEAGQRYCATCRRAYRKDWEAMRNEELKRLRSFVNSLKASYAAIEDFEIHAKTPDETSVHPTSSV